MTIPVITIDGPSGSGKGTVGQLLAARLGFHFLDSGALYRATGIAAHRKGISTSDAVSLSWLAISLPVKFVGDRVLLGKEDITDELRNERSGALASEVAQWPELRLALLGRQRDFVCAPGLVADGRDMGTVVFPNALLKIFLTASAEERAQRRYNQLIAKGENVSLRALVDEIQARDERDSGRTVSPLKPAQDSLVIDSTGMSVEDVLNRILTEAQKRLK